MCLAICQCRHCLHLQFPKILNYFSLASIWAQMLEADNSYIVKSKQRRRLVLTILFMLQKKRHDDKQKIFYNRSTNSAAFCALQRMSFKPPCLLYNSNSRITANKEANCKIVILLNVPLVQNPFLINAQLQSFFFVPRQISMFLLTKNIHNCSHLLYFYRDYYILCVGKYLLQINIIIFLIN